MAIGYKEDKALLTNQCLGKEKEQMLSDELRIETLLTLP